MLNIRQYNIKRLNISLLAVVIILAVTGSILIKIVAPDLFLKQVLGIILGIIICVGISLIDYHTVCGFSVIIYAVAIVLLILVQIPGIGAEINDARRWIDLELFTVQPSELCKVAMIIVLAHFFTLFRESINNIKVIGMALVILLIPMTFIFIQPDLSSSLVLVFFFVIMLYSAGISYKIIVPFLLVSIPVSVVGIWYLCQPYQGILHGYQQERILGLLYPERYADTMYQQNKAVNMISNGKLYGIANGGSTDELACVRLPIIESDFIFTSVGETFGFLGACVIIILLMILIFKCLTIAKKSKDFTGKMICIGVSAMFMFQVFANIGVVTRILPNTGLPLPFVSYGLSALVSYFAAIGLVINIGLQGKNTSRG